MRQTVRLSCLIVVFLLLTAAAVGQVTFTDVTASAGTGLGVGTSRGIAWIDFNNDGLLDLFLPTAGNTPNKLYSNKGTGTFLEVAANVGLNDSTNTFASSWADIDNDGDLDLVTVASGPTRLWRNNRQGGTDTTFTRIEVAAGISQNAAQMSVWADYNRDGFIDFYGPISGSASSPDALYRNNGNSTFTNLADSAGVNHQSSTSLEQAVLWGDYTKDGFPDLYIGNVQTGGPSYLHRNNGNGTFAEVAATLGVQGASRGGQWMDFNNDGLWDLVVAAQAGGANTTPIKVFRNNGDGTFTEVGASIGIAEALLSWSVACADYDNNGYEDILVTASGASTFTQFYKNVGGTFVNVTSEAGLSGLAMLSAAWGDYNNDGSIDLFTAGASAGNHLFRNNGSPGKHWLEVKLVGTQTNRAGIGTQIDIKAGALHMMREISAGVGYRNQNMPFAHFGLDTNRVVDSLVVRWPSGRRSLLRAIAGDSVITITEPGPQAVPLKETPIAFGLGQNYPNPFNPGTTIEYQLPTQSHVVLGVFDVLGREVATIVNGIEEPGYKAVRWDGSGRASGVYFCRLFVSPPSSGDLFPADGRDGHRGALVQTRRMLLLK